ncbi:isochorismatase family protein [Aneurinibacillus sp. REN35]|uniref:isochorismatase family protein n=1 Tax=Aneurinibacillus sp. REN35 TaxID=3237286 RepID=UPI003527A9FE
MHETFAGFGHASGFGTRPCVIVVDFITGFTDPRCELGSDYTRELAATLRLLEAARQNNVLVVFTTVVYEAHLRDGGHFIKKVPALKALTEGSAWSTIDPSLKRDEMNEPLITKKFASSFFGTHLHSLLTSEGVDTTLITGCTTSGCVRATVVDALQYGYRVVVPKECVGDRSPSAHQANLYDIRTKYGDVVNLDTAVQYLHTIHS